MHNDTIAQMQKMVAEFVTEREWNQFHNTKNLSIAIAVEAAELMEHFMWCATEASGDVLKKNREAIEDEFADVLIGLLCFANAANIDVFKAFAHKLEKTKRKYPIEMVRGKSDKYTHYMELKKRARQ
jgi:NTP pyrophosphatase (non-canonical NTP hydrolase)